MPHHIVIVEDEPVTQARLQSYFTQEGYTVSVTASGAGLREIMQNQPVDLILLDINLPDENGLMLTAPCENAQRWGLFWLPDAAIGLTVLLGWKWAQTITSPNRWSCANWWYE